AHSSIACQGVPIIASVVDQPAAMIGHGSLQAGMMKATYGTGCFVNLNTGQKATASQHNLLTLLAWKRDGITTYGLEGGVFAAAAAVNWLLNGMGRYPENSSIDDLCATVSDSGGARWNPGPTRVPTPVLGRPSRG